MDSAGIPIPGPNDESDRLVSSSSATSSSFPSVSARYKLMSPAMLPISRSPCITIPPGLSPTSFLDSPVLLSNFKVEPSPTTGSLNKLHLNNGFLGSNFEIRAANHGHAEGSDEGNCGEFEFKPLARSNLVSGQFRNQTSEQSDGISSPAKSPSGASPNPAKSHSGVPSELSLSTPAGPVISDATMTADDDVDAINCREQPNRGVGTGALVLGERLSEDGYNWRKYGQKHVKGCEFPRSYYKCTYPNCEVKKLFERSPEGHITEIIYKGMHDHPKPQPGRRFTAGGIVPSQPPEERTDKLSFPTSDKSPPAFGDASGILELSPIAENETGEEAAFVSNRILEEVDDDEDGPLSKRWKQEIVGDVNAIVKPIREPRVVVQTISEVDILDDGYRWRKYGQKVVRGNPNPRSYYKCTNVGCPVRKHVERASHDPKAVITTYEGKHNHDVPTAKSSSHDTAGPSNGPSRVRSEGEMVSLDLGVGRSTATEMTTSEKQPLFGPEYVRSQFISSSSNMSAIPGARMYNSFRGILHEVHAAEMLPLAHPSHPHPPNVERMVIGP
ncbi:hypothetical protein MLD38_040778 [Melastoma candidum]|nr:hypothetical protein MLD38_040778 [Melastoma candidum]